MLPALPQFLYQAPPGAQQLRLPDFLTTPHLGHALLLTTTEGLVVVNASVGMRRESNKYTDDWLQDQSVAVRHAWEGLCVCGGGGGGLLEIAVATFYYCMDRLPCLIVTVHATKSD